MKIFTKKYFYYTLLIFLIITSCNAIRQSSFSKDNLIKQSYFVHYFNDSLRLYIRFFGGHQPVNPPFKNYKKHTPKAIKAYLKKEAKHNKKYQILFYSYSPWKQFGFYYVGFLRKKSLPQKSFQEMESTNHSVFYEKNGVERIDSFILKEYMIPLKNYNFLFFCFKKILFNFKVDSGILQSDTHSELMTLKALSNFEPYNKTTKYFSDSINTAANLPGYATPLDSLLKFKNGNRSKADVALLNQYLFFQYANFDEIDIIKQLLYEQHTYKENSIKNRSTDTVIVNTQLAIPYILKNADSQKVIMINESHYDWRHRYFVTLLLDSLFKKGYKYFCMEALNNPNNINERKFPISDDGFYIKEPFMANLARKALKIGYKLIAYEDTTTNLEENLFNSSIDKREYYQALNLYDRYKKDTGAKWLVYAGYSHINKLRFGPTEPSTMAKYFSEFSHVDPYSINQTAYCDIFNTKLPIDSDNDENYYYLQKDQINDSILLKQSDLYIINNIHTIPYEIHDTAKGTQEYDIHYHKKKSEEGKYFIEVYLKNEYFQNHHAIPIYIKIDSKNVFDKSIWLPKNNYYLIITDNNDKIIYENNL